ncbi:MAG TPA: rhodanese-like domain-containing protein [Gemmatimonadales bacterium]|nr:rhodanese-like domain-containing protein [Gemmatimonadales bacterium]
MAAQKFSAVREYPAADPAVAQRHYLARLAVETDVSDVIHDLTAGTGNLILLDVRSPEDYALCHIPGAQSLPHRRISAETTRDFPRDALLVTYCWGVACNSSTKGAAKLAALGFQVKEMIGGIEYWRHEGCPVEGTLGDNAPLHWKHAG